MSTEIKPGQVWAWNDGRTGPGPEFTITSLGSYSGGGVRVNYSYSGDLDVFDLDVASIQKRAHLVKDVDATPAPLDPFRVKVGDTVTLERGRASVTDEVAAWHRRPHGHFSVTLVNDPAGPPYRVVGGITGTSWALTAHQPAPEPEPEWKPGTVGTATINNAPGARVLRAGVEGVISWWVAQDGCKYDDTEVTDFVPDEPRPLPTRGELYAALTHSDVLKTDPRSGLTYIDPNLAAEHLAVFLRGESR